jgi:transposase
MSQQTAITPRRNGTVPNSAPNPEVKPAVKRRTFSREYKLRILAEAERSTESGAIGALLRREGLYSSHLTTWRRQREAGELAPGAGKQRGRRADKQAQDLARVQRENQRLRAKLEQAELIIAAQKKLAQALESTLTQPQDRPS